MDSQSSNSSTYILIIILLVLAVGGYVFLASSSDSAPQAATENTGDSQLIEGEALSELAAVDQTTAEITEPEAMAEKTEDDDMMEDAMKAESEDAMKADTMHDGVTEEVAAMKEETTETPASVAVDPAPVAALASGSFETYSPSKLALAEAGDVVLFFHADWCPTCRGLENNINSDLSAIPDGVHILKLDYDTETALKQKYGVVRQHTLVHVDANGGEIKKLTGLTNTLSQVVSQL